LYFDPTADDQEFLKISGGYGGGISCLRICNFINTTSYKNLIGLHLEDCSSFDAWELDIELQDDVGETYMGDNGIGLKLSRSVIGNESMTIQRFDSTAAIPVYFQSGNNITLRDFDLRVLGGISGNLPDTTPAKSAAILCGKNFKSDFFNLGPGSTQGGEYLIHCDSTTTAAGGTLFMQNIRAEQLVINGTEDNAAITFRVTNTVPDVHSYESIEIVGCRTATFYDPTWPPYGWDISGSLLPPVISGSTFLAGYAKPGSQQTIQQINSEATVKYAADTTERDDLFDAGVFAGSSIFVAGVGLYFILINYMGPFEDAVEGTDYIGPLSSAGANTAPVGNNETLSYEFISIGDDYLDVHDRAFEWDVPGLPTFLASECTCKFGGTTFPQATQSFTASAAGTCTDNGDGTWKCKVDLAATDTEGMEEAVFRWSMEIVDPDDNEVTRAGGDYSSIVWLRLKGTN
jgi:hypothetical protein